MKMNDLVKGNIYYNRTDNYFCKLVNKGYHPYQVAVVLPNGNTCECYADSLTDKMEGFYLYHNGKDYVYESAYKNICDKVALHMLVIVARETKSPLLDRFNDWLDGKTDEHTKGTLKDIKYRMEKVTVECGTHCVSINGKGSTSSFPFNDELNGVHIFTYLS